MPAVQAAKDHNIPVIAYDRLIEDPSVLYITFNNIGVGKAQAEALLKKVPTGNYVIIKGDPGDPNASTFLPEGYKQAGLLDKIQSGEITVLNSTGTNWPQDYGTFTDAWDTSKAQQNMEAIIDKARADGKTIDAILAENDSTALGVVAALIGRGLSGLLAFYLGYGVAHLLAIGLGLVLPPSEAEVLERLFYQVYGSIIGTVGYLGPVLVRALLRRTRRPT